jgi:sodium-dependent dicarboxylate transporter 2/3/5
MGAKLAGLARLPLPVQFLIVAAATVALSAAASNTATTTLMMTILRPFGVPLMATSAIAASCDFALPAGTPPNAVIFGSGYVTVPRMMKVGALLDLVAAVVAGLWGWLGVRWLLSL